MPTYIHAVYHVTYHYVAEHHTAPYICCITCIWCDLWCIHDMHHMHVIPITLHVMTYRCLTWHCIAYVIHRKKLHTLYKCIANITYILHCGTLQYIPVHHCSLHYIGKWHQISSHTRASLKARAHDCHKSSCEQRGMSFGWHFAQCFLKTQNPSHAMPEKSIMPAIREMAMKSKAYKWIWVNVQPKIMKALWFSWYPLFYYFFCQDHLPLPASKRTTHPQLILIGQRRSSEFSLRLEQHPMSISVVISAASNLGSGQCMLQNRVVLQVLNLNGFPRQWGKCFWKTWTHNLIKNGGNALCHSFNLIWVPLPLSISLMRVLYLRWLSPGSWKIVFGMVTSW